MEIAKADSLATFSLGKYSRVPIANAEGLLRLLCFEPGQNVPQHKHPEGDEYFFVIKGEGKITVGNERAEAEPGSIIKAPAGVWHKWENGSARMILLSILIPLQSYKLANEATKMEFT